MIAGAEELRASRRRQDAVTELGQRALASATTESGLDDAVGLIARTCEMANDALITLDPSSWLFTSANPSAIAMFGARDEADFLSRAPGQYSSERQPNGRDSAELVEEIGGKAQREGFCLSSGPAPGSTARSFPPPSS